MESGQLRWNGKIHPTLIIFPSRKSRAPDDYLMVARISFGFHWFWFAWSDASALRPFDGFPRMSRAFLAEAFNNELLPQHSEDIH